MTTIPEPIYCTVAQLTAELGLGEGELPGESEAVNAIEQAEDLIDRLLGGWFWSGDEETGRKVAKGDVLGWQWAKLERATTLLAARLYRDQSLLDQLYESMSGPDFSMGGAKGGAIVKMIGVQVLVILDDSGLRRIAGRARQGRRRPIKPAYQQFLEATRHDGT